MVGFCFNTIGVSDGISMGTDGMSFSLQSRDLIADSIETVMGAQWYDGTIAIPGCDKNMPGCIIAMGRLNRPGIMVYGGTIRAGQSARHPKLDIVSAFQSYGEFVYDRIDEQVRVRHSCFFVTTVKPRLLQRGAHVHPCPVVAVPQERVEIVRNACPGPGACGGMYTANTMATAIEALGMSLPYSSSTPADDDLKKDECERAAKAMLNLLERDIKPRDIMTKSESSNTPAPAFVMQCAITDACAHVASMGPLSRVCSQRHSRTPS